MPLEAKLETIVPRPHVEIRAKERLTGAVILVALVVLLVPELLSGTHRTSAPSETASEEAPLRSVTIRLDEESHRGASSSEAPAEPVAAAPAPAPPTAARAAEAQPTASAPAAPAAGHGDAAPASKPAAAHPPGSSEVWSVQLGSFESRENAERLVRELKRKGFTARVAAGEGRGREWYRVRAGPARDRAAAQSLARRLKAAGHAGSVVAAY